MMDENPLVTLRRLLANEQVLLAAWRRVDAWYESVEWQPQPELTTFKARLHSQLRTIGRDLANDEYRLDPFRLVPYPKDHDTLRHYCTPSVRDQVAFGVFCVLLGPLVERRLPLFVFGNRISRGLTRQASPAGHFWKEREFALDAPTFYLPYRRDYGLFRRVAAWTASAIVRAPRRVSDERPEDYGVGRVPSFVDPAAWEQASQGYWAKVDLQLAYPSVRIARLSEALRQLVAGENQEILALYEPGFPRPVANDVAACAPALAVRLSKMLADVTYEQGPISDEHWRPRGDRTLPSSSLDDLRGAPGLPTGLAIAGFAFNVAMRGIDDAMNAADQGQDPRRTSCFLRFADDMILMATSEQALEARLSSLKGAIDAEGFAVNVGKLKSPAAKKVFVGGPDAAGDEPPADEPAAQPRQPEARFSREGLEPFVTYLLERLSALGADDPRFGRPAEHHLVQLHQLARLEFREHDVRAETRLTFAANRLGRAFLPIEAGDRALDDIRDIRASIADCRRRAPAKVGLWRAIVRAACRRTFLPNAAESEAVEAERWLSAQLKHVAFQDDDRPVERLRRSMHRAMFWRELAAALRDLDQVPRLDNEVPSASRWPAGAWTFRAVDEHCAPKVRSWLGLLERWTKGLYPKRAQPPIEWWWEWDSLALAKLAVTDLTVLVARGATGRKDEKRRELAVPVGLRDRTHVASLLRGKGRALSPTAWMQLAPTARLAALAMAGRRMVLLRKHRPEIRHLLREWGSVADPEEVVVGAHDLGWSAALPASLRLRVPPPESVTFFDLRAAARDRSRELARWSEKRPVRKRATLLEVLWALPGQDRVEVLPVQASAVGLPIRVVVRLLANALEQELREAAARLAHAPSEHVAWRLAHAPTVARLRLRALFPSARTGSTRAKHGVDLASLGGFGEGPVPLHPAFSMAHVLGAQRHGTADRVLAHLLQFFIAASGDERFLDSLLETWLSPVFLEERWRLRCRIPLPTDVWYAIDRLLRDSLNGKDPQVEEGTRNLLAALHPYSRDVRPSDFTWDRIDVDLRLDGASLDVPMGSGQMDLPGGTSRPGPLPREMVARLGQVSAAIDWVQYAKRFDRIHGPRDVSRAERQRILGQVTEAFEASAYQESAGSRAGLVLLPEVSVPVEEIPELEKLAARTKRAVLAGLTWRAVPLVRRGGPLASARAPWTRFLVNEAILIAPVTAAGDSSRPIYRQFFIRKPVPTHAEHALCTVVSDRAGVEWNMLPGRSWYRFVHPRWGDFTVAICSDLSDPRPWASFEGQVLHLFMVSCNADIDLFEQLTWVRAFELHANVVAANHGLFGGSFVWTPQHKQNKEIARLRGPGLTLFADVELTVEPLAHDQRVGLANAVDKERGGWLHHNRPETCFKAPRPGYKQRK